ncbi:MAG: amidohydrolase family protein [Anaerolineae bacterium]|nr:amidohydrolase family protein [Anaerolineae bacterium]
MTHPIDPELLAGIQRIRAIDNHSHALHTGEPDPKASERADPLGKAPFAYPVRLRVTHPEYVEAWRALWGYRHADMTDDHAREALRAKLDLMKQKGDAYPSWVLDQAGIETMCVNMWNLGPGQQAPRFRWIIYADQLLSPFTGEKEDNGPPTSLDDYMDAVVKQQIQEWKDDGAIAIKFGIAYSRSLDVADVDVADARGVYTRQAKGESPSATDHKALQDYLFRAICGLAGTLELPVQIHTGVGAQPYFNISGSNPMLLEPTFNDENLRHTTFVILHGGWPYEREAGALLLKPNVRIDFSAQPFLRSTQALSATLQAWLEWYPKKVLFGTDAYPDDTPLANWEEKVWLVTRTARQALALALTRMIEEGQIPRTRAEKLARMVLRESAMGVYDLA